MNFTHLVGNTPMIRIRYRLDGQEQSVWAKLEAYNLSGSIKDRLAAHVIAKSTANGTLKPGQPIVEMTSANTGIAFAALGALTKHPVHIFMPDWASEERKKLMAMYGAVLHLVSRKEGGFNAALQGAKDMAEEIGAFQPRQFENQDNPEAHYLTTGVEILRQLPGVPDFVAGVGSGGTLMGTARRLKEAGQCRAVAVEPDAAALLTGGTVTGPHRIEGIGDDFIPAVVDPTLIDHVADINDLDAIASDVPIFLQRACGHIVCMNTMALQLAGLWEARTAAEKALKNILKSARAAGIRRIAAVVAARRSGIFMAKLVVACSALVIGKHLVCFVDLLERFLRRLIARVQIRVVFLRQTAVSALDLGIRRTALYAQHLVIIAFCQRCFLLTRKGMTQSFRAIPFFAVSSSYLSSCTS